MMEKVTAGRDELGEFAPKFAQLNDDVLFGEVWSRQAELSPRDRSMVTVTALMASGFWTVPFPFIYKTPKTMASPPRRWRKFSPTARLLCRLAQGLGRPAEGERSL